MADLVERPPLQVTRRVARARQEGHDASDNAFLRRGSRRGDLLWLDRWAARASRQRNVPATIHTPKRSEPLVSTEHRHRREVERLGPNASVRRSRGSAGQSGWSVEYCLRRTSERGGSRGFGGRPDCQSSCSGKVSDAHKSESVLHPPSDRKRKEVGDPSQTYRAVCGDAGPRRDHPPARSTITSLIDRRRRIGAQFAGTRCRPAQAGTSGHSATDAY